MSEVWLPALIALAAVGLTYVFCVRPMRRGRTLDTSADDAHTSHLEHALVQARAELAQLRQDRTTAAAAGSGSLTTPTNHDGRTS